MNQAQIKALKEFARLVVIALVSAGLMAAQAYVGLITDPMWAVPLTFLVGAILKAWDKYKHEDSTSSTGIVPF